MRSLCARTNAIWLLRIGVAARPAQLRVLPYFSQNARTSLMSGGENVTLANILWTVLVILVVLWLIGLVANIGGGLIHVLLVIAAIVLIYNLIAGRSTV